MQIEITVGYYFQLFQNSQRLKKQLVVVRNEDFLNLIVKGQFSSTAKALSTDHHLASLPG